MSNLKKFMKNFGVSLIAYFAVCFLGYWGRILLFFATYSQILHSIYPISIPWWVEIILWLSVIVSVALCFYFGTRLKLISNHLLNFLSVSGSSVIGLLLILLALCYDPFLITFGGFSFLRIIMLFIGVDWPAYDDYIAISIVSILPSLIIWFGMLYQSKKVKREVK